MSRLLSTDDFVGVSVLRMNCRNRLTQRLNLLENIDSANVQQCAEMIFNEGMVRSVDFKWKWGDEELPCQG